MPFELESLVGYLYIVGGRAISTNPPGALVEVAPRKAARGRETDTFFAMVLPSGEVHASSSFYEQLSQLAAERYFESTGSVTSGLREVFHALNKNLYDHNATNAKSYEANLICAVLRGNELIVGRVGAGIMVLREEGQTATLPDDLSNDEAIFTAPLGVQATPNVRLRQYRVTKNARLLFCDANIADFDMDRITNALVSSDLSMVLVAFKELARLNLTIMAIELVPPESAVPETVPIGESTAQIAEAARESKRVSREEKRQERQIGTKVLRTAQRGLSNTAGGMAQGLSVTNKALGHFFGEDEDDADSDEETKRKKSFFSSTLGSSMVILLPLGVVIGIVILWLSGMGQSNFEGCLGEVLTRRDNALSVPASEVQVTINAWTLVLQQIAVCEEMREGDPTINTVKTDAQTVIDALNQIDRRQVITLDVIFPGARLSQIETRGTDLYVLEETTSTVYRIPLSPDGSQRIGSSLILPMSRSQVIDGYTIADIVDIAINSNGDIVGVDTNGVLMTCSARFNECDAQQLQGVELWVNPVAIDVWSSDDRLYVLDSGAGSGQLWWYDKSGGIYPNNPSEWFGNLRIIDNPIDFMISDGTVFIMSATGTLGRYRSGEQQSFTFTAFPLGQELDLATAMFIDDSPTSQSIYIVHQPRATIYETTLSGFFRASYQSSSQEFDLIADVATIGGLNWVYAVSGNTVFAFQKDLN